jgi:hypothetical protein
LTDQTQTTIFTVTTLHFHDAKYGISPRTVGWFPDLETATTCVTENWGDIFETSYTYAVIESLPSGLYPHAIAEHWFQWHGTSDDGHYEPCAKPEQLNGVIGFAVG